MKPIIPVESGIQLQVNEQFQFIILFYVWICCDYVLQGDKSKSLTSELVKYLYRAAQIKIIWS